MCDVRENLERVEKQSRRNLERLDILEKRAELVFSRRIDWESDTEERIDAIVEKQDEIEQELAGRISALERAAEEHSAQLSRHFRAIEEVKRSGRKIDRDSEQSGSNPEAIEMAARELVGVLRRQNDQLVFMRGNACIESAYNRLCDVLGIMP